MMPGTSNDGDKYIMPASGYRPRDGLKPATPQNAAGMRADPLVSDTTARFTMPCATATAPPLLDPPATRGMSARHGVSGVPNVAFRPSAP
ncbi:hypothetical protein D9M68_819840 [compost metagenome]